MAPSGGRYSTAHAIPPLTGPLLKIFTHILVTTVGVKALQLHGGDVALAYAFGVAIDIDHVLKLPYYLKAVGLEEKQLGYYWRSSLQEPVGFFWIVPLCFFLGTYIPALFYFLHLCLDYSVRFEKMPLYPYSKWVARGWLIDMKDNTKELIVFVTFACLLIALYVR